MIKPRRSTPGDTEQARATAMRAIREPAPEPPAAALSVNIDRYDLALLAGGHVVRVVSAETGTVVFLRVPSGE